MRVDGELERGARLVVVALRGVEHREVVVRLGQLRVILREAGEHLDRFGHALLLGVDEAFQEASLWIARRCLEEYLDLVERGRELSLSVELLRLAQIVHGRGNDMESERCGDR